MRTILVLLVALAILGCRRDDSSIRDFRVDFLTNLGNSPCFSWKLDGAGENLSQSAYRIEVDGVWDSGKQLGNSSLQIAYTGPDLEPGKQYAARIQVWDQDNIPGDWSEELLFFVPLEYPENWEAAWITYDYDASAPLPIFRKTFEVTDPENIDFARFYISAPGYYEASLNGEKIGDFVLDPGQTNYEDYAYYTAYDIDPDDLKQQNVLGIMLGNGWYNQNQVWIDHAGNPGLAYGPPVFICQLVIQQKDGSTLVVVSDESWQWAYGPITYSNAYGGEHYDARREIPGWDEPEEVEGEWLAATGAEIHPEELFEQFAEPIRIMDKISPRSIEEREDGTYMFDFGQNLTGWMELSIDGETGQEITIKCAEVLWDNRLDTLTTGFRATRVVQTQKYICKGGGTETWRPRFNYAGFRYAHVTGLNEAPAKEILTAHVCYSAFRDVGSFTCSEENLNRLHDMARWTIIGNSQSIITDCPHREKCGWTGDAHAGFKPINYNYDAQRFFEKYMFDMRSSGREEKVELYFGANFHERSMRTKPAGITTMIVPGKRTSGIASPDWGTAMAQIPWYLYLYYGDLAILEDFYPDIKGWVEYIETIKEDGIIPHGLGDWCPPGGNSNKDCPVPVSSSAFHILDVDILQKTAALLGLTKDHAYYADLHQQLKLDFNRHFFDPETSSYGTAQTANIMALDIGIVPEGKEKHVCEAILKNMDEEYDGFLNTGIFGIARVFKVLSENGFENEVYRLLTRTGENSFANMWDRFDATTLWEVLPTREEFGGDYRGSMNHPMQSGFDAWFYSGIAGINPTEEGPGFQKIIFKPYLTRQMASVSARYDSKSGSITSEWDRSEETLKWRIVIPPNTKGNIFVPTYESEGNILMNGNKIEGKQTVDGFTEIGEFGSGDYLIELAI